MKTKLFRRLSGIIALLFLFQNLSAQWSMSYTTHFRYANSLAVLNYNNIVLVGGNEFNGRIRTIYTTQDTAQSWDVVYDDDNPWLKSVARVSSSGLVACGYEGEIIKSPDAGTTWNWLTTPTQVANRQFNSAFFVDSLVGYIAGGYKVMDSLQQTIIKTTDGGASWTVQRDTASYFLNGIYFSDASHGIAVGTQGTIVRTADGGANWQIVPLSGDIAIRDLNGVYMVNNMVGFIVGGNKSNDSIQTILKTTDGGQTWNVLQDQLGSMLNGIDFSSSSKGYIVGDLGTVLFSEDAGNTWTSLDLPDSLRNHICWIYSMWIL